MPGDRDRRAEKRLQAVLLDHPATFSAVCETARGLESRYGEPQAAGDKFVAVGLIDLARRIEGAGGASCLTPVVAALPPTSLADTVIGDARTLCVNTDARGNVCERIVR